MTKKEIRLECLKQASLLVSAEINAHTNNAGYAKDVVTIANRFNEFVTKGS